MSAMRAKKKSLRALAKEAADAHCDLNIFYAVIAILEGGCLYNTKSDRAAERIIKICKDEAQRRLDDYDRALDRLD